MISSLFGKGCSIFNTEEASWFSWFDRRFLSTSNYNKHPASSRFLSAAAQCLTYMASPPRWQLRHCESRPLKSGMLVAASSANRPYRCDLRELWVRWETPTGWLRGSNSPDYNGFLCFSEAQAKSDIHSCCASILWRGDLTMKPRSSWMDRRGTKIQVQGLQGPVGL